MSSESKRNLFASVKVRLTLLVGAVIACCSLAAFGIAYANLVLALESNVDHYLGTELNEFKNIYDDGGMVALREEVQLEEIAQGSSNIFISVLDTSGRVIVASDKSHWGNAAEWEGPMPASRATSFRTVASEPDARPGRRIEGHIAEDVFVVMGVGTEQHRVVLDAFRERFIEVFVLVVCISLLGAWLVARRAMGGVEAVTVAAEEIAGGALDRRIMGHGYGYEIDRLGSVFNMMIEKVVALIKEARMLNDNIAHELRSPLTRIRGVAEASAVSNATSLDCRELAANVVEECDGLLNVVNSMLAISQIESGLAKFDTHPVDCGRLVQDTSELFLPLAEDKRITLETAVTDGVVVNGDRARLHQAVANLIDNALKYTAPGGKVTVSLERKNGSAVIAVHDTGLGIGQNELPHIFKRFYRSDNVRSAPGNGLGLGLVHAIVVGHGGEVEVSSSQGKGSTFRVILPAS